MAIIRPGTKQKGNALKGGWDFHFCFRDFDPPLPTGAYGGAVRLRRGWCVTICKRGGDPTRPPDWQGIPLTVCGANLDKTFELAIELLSANLGPKISELRGGSWYTPKDWKNPEPPKGLTVEPEGE